MDKKSRILLIIVVMVSIISISFTFYQTVIGGGFISRFDIPVRN